MEWGTGEKNIYKERNGNYSVRKMIDGHSYYFASFKTLEDAVKYRDYCKAHDWDLKCRRKTVGRMFSISDMEMSEGEKIV